MSEPSSAALAAAEAAFDSELSGTLLIAEDNKTKNYIRRSIHQAVRAAFNATEQSRDDIPHSEYMRQISNAIAEFGDQPDIAGNMIGELVSEWDGKMQSATVQANDDLAEWRIESYLDVPEHDVTGSYGQVLRHIAKDDWCARYVIKMPRSSNDLDLYLQTLRQTLEDEEVTPLIKGAEKYTIRIHHKNSGPEWTVEVDCG